MYISNRTFVMYYNNKVGGIIIYSRCLFKLKYYTYCMYINNNLTNRNVLTFNIRKNYFIQINSRNIIHPSKSP